MGAVVTMFAVTPRAGFVLIAAIMVVSGALAQEPFVGPVEPPAANTPAPLPAQDNNPYLARIQQLEVSVFDRDAEIVHLQAEWANCRATVDSTVLTSQAIELVRRCEATFGGKCTWDDKARRVVRVEPEKEKE